MNGLGAYVFSLVAAALLCAVVLSLFQEGAGKEVVRLVCGLLLCVTALGPLIRLDLEALLRGAIPELSDASRYAQEGTQATREAVAQRIKEELEAYILAEGLSWEAELSPEVILGEDLLPKKVVIRGAVSPFVRQRLEQALENDLGIAKENQQWTG